MQDMMSKIMLNVMMKLKHMDIPNTQIRKIATKKYAEDVAIEDNQNVQDKGTKDNKHEEDGQEDGQYVQDKDKDKEERNM